MTFNALLICLISYSVQRSFPGLFIPKVEVVHVKEFMTELEEHVSRLVAHGACFTTDVNLVEVMETRSGSSS